MSQYYGIYIPFTIPFITGGGQGGYDQDSLSNADGDDVLQSPGDLDGLINSDGDAVLQSPFTCRNNLLDSDGDFVLNSDGDTLLDGGNCTSPILATGNIVASKI